MIFSAPVAFGNRRGNNLTIIENNYIIVYKRKHGLRLFVY